MVVSRVVVPVAVGALVVIQAGRARRRFVPARRCSPGVVADTARRAGRADHFRRRARLTDDDVAAWCDDLAGLVRSGASLATALRSVSPAPALAQIVAPIGLALDRGDSVAGATRRVASSAASVDLALGVVRACADLGGPAAQSLDRTASTLRARAADVAERQVYSAQARLSALVLTLLPGVALGMLLATSESARVAVIGPAGAICLSAGTALNAIGWWWMRRIIGSAS
jgi:tight adherence protein B